MAALFDRHGVEIAAGDIVVFSVARTGGSSYTTTYKVDVIDGELWLTEGVRRTRYEGLPDKISRELPHGLASTHHTLYAEVRP